MPEKYLSVGGVCVTEKIIEKSRFITTSAHIESEEEAKTFIKNISEKFRDATHNCYAYIADSPGNFLRFSDDGEPQGTAGMPILEVIKNKNLVQTAVVVTRYFGGIKLGAGGLLRAYSGCAAENLDVAQKVSYEVCAENKITVDYAYTDAAMRFFNEFHAELKNTEYLDRVVFTVAVKKSEEQRFLSSLTDRLNGRAEINREKEYYFPFKISG